ncbi:MAG TPA: T9SS type A sorting domain-containing protein [Flavobacteriales bacterium]|nr:T9SS type A sorting domain-containing protein [Flavobacteriales bacterium]
MFVKKIVFLLLLFVPFVFNAQSNNSQDNFKCGISQQTAAIIKQRLMDNRQLYNKQEVKDLMTNRVITYIPLSIHNVAGDANGLGKTSEQTILGFLCGLNAIYADQDVQFFIHNSIRNHVSTYIYNNAATSTSRAHMLRYKINNTLNLIIGSSALNQVASWYDGFGDFIFLLQSMLTTQAKTEAHEIGHFFTLPHTFYGWESMDAEATYGGQNVPSTVGSGWSAFSPETVPRSGGQSNCSWASDGFCDTEADYYSDRTNCPYNPTMNDRYGNALNPDETNMMSYALDHCVDNFSSEQQTAMAIDIASRSWVTNTPNSTADVTGVATAVSPQNNGQLGSVSNATVRLDWSDVSGATWYYLEVIGTMIPGLWLPNTSDVIFKGIIYTGSYYDLSTTELVAGNHYAWRVKAINASSTCAGISSYYSFEAVTSVTAIKDLPIEKQMSFKVNSNPISTSFIPLSVYAAVDVLGSIKIFSMDGREVLAVNKQIISQGHSLVQIPAGHLPNGMYTAVLITDRGQLQQKLIIQK